VVSELIRLVHFVDEHQAPDDLAERVPLLMAVADPGVRDGGVVKGDEIGVVGEDDATFGEPEGDVFFVGGADQAHDCGGRHIDPVKPKTGGYRRVAVLISSR
jgi:hypothetical protein